MKLQKITIEDYRSIKKIPFTIKVREDNSFTYGLIGINEAGKSSILKAIGLKDGLLDASGTKLPLSKDFRQKKDIYITYSYEITPADDQKLYELINHKVEDTGLEKPVEIESEIVESIPAESKKDKTVKNTYDSVSSDLFVNFRICFKTASSEPIFSVTIINNDQEIKTSKSEEILSFFKESVHKTIFWTAEDRYLISKPINISQFIADTSISIPLRNCFLLASIKEEQINQSLSDALADTTDCEFLEETLANNVTEHIKSAWPNHPVKITFKIMDGHINFHVKDLGSKGKAQTSDMRSDGFKQFVSFLLTIAAENKNEELENTILLLDEPETHLHPKAQEYLLTQLIGITTNKKNNVVLFATHSNYMIDKKDLGRYFRVQKKTDESFEEHTHATQFDKKLTSYAEVSFEVFDILDEQYHNELYDKLRDFHVKEFNSKEADEEKHIESIGINPFDDQYFKQMKKLSKDYQDTSKKNTRDAKVTLPTYIRNCIHYPANKKSNFDEKLRESIFILREYALSDIK